MSQPNSVKNLQQVNRITEWHACIVRDGAIGIDGEAHGHGAQHAEGSQGHAEHATQAVREEDGHAEADHRHDAGQVSEGKAIDDAGGCRLLLSLGDLAHWGVAVGSVVLGHVANDEARPGQAAALKIKKYQIKDEKKSSNTSVVNLIRREISL